LNIHWFLCSQYDLRQRKEKKDKKAKGRKNPSYHLDAEVTYHEALAKAAIPHYSRLYPCLLVRKTYHIVRWMIYKCLYVYRRWKLGSKPEETLEADTQIINPQGKKRRGRNYKKEDEIGEETVSDVENVVATNDEMKDEVIVEEVIQELTEEEKERLYEKEVEERKEFEEELKLLEENMEDDWNLITKKKTKKAHSTKIKSPQADKSLEFKSELLETFEEVTSYDEQDIPHEEAPSLPPSPPGAWSQYQQKQLEWGLTRYTKEEKNRWELIAEVVPEKSAEECKMRYKELVELVRNKKTQ
jgi:DnaJ family protein C protein 1